MTQHEVQHGGKPSSETGPAASPRRPIYKDFVLLQLFAIVFLSDQFTKWLVREFLELRESVPTEGFFRLTHPFNTGSAFGLFRDQNFPLILVSVVGIAILMLIYRSQRQPGNLLRLSLGLQFGGAAGNLLDRIRLGHVTDFVDVGSWPIFNVADASIVVGLVILAWMFLIADGSKTGAKSSGTTSDSAALGGTASGTATGIPIFTEGSNKGIPTGLEASLPTGDGDDGAGPPSADFGGPDGAPKAAEPGESSVGE